MRTEYLQPSLSGALSATKREAERAAAIHAALVSDLTPAGARLVERPDGAWTRVWPDTKEGGDAA